jgi:hypothetical protein
MTAPTPTPEQLRARAFAGSRREAMRNRARRIRRAVAGLAVTLFATAFLIVYVQLASGHDPALVANAAKRPAAVVSTNQASAADTSKSASTEADTSSESTSDGDTSSGSESATSTGSESTSSSDSSSGTEAASSESSESSSGASAVTTSQS